MPQIFRRLLDRALRHQLQAPGQTPADFTEPKDEPALAGPDSVSWQVFRNPVPVAIGGIAAVVLELAEPRVRAGVWNHTSFRDDPVTRLRRTGLAAMITVYGARSRAERMIAGVRRMHERVRGTTPEGLAYAASDPELLCWVQATAAYGFLQAYRTYIRPLGLADRDRFYLEGVPASQLYGAEGIPRSEAELETLFRRMEPHLRPSVTVFEFLDIMRRAPILPGPLRPMQRLLVEAAVEIVPEPVRRILGLGPEYGLRGFEKALVRKAARLADRIVLPSSPAVQSCLRLGLPADYLFCDEG
jgi:uncharacterized protein (DUF2236 family)